MVEVLVPAAVFFGLMIVGARVAVAMGVAGALGLLLTSGFRPTVSVVEQVFRNEATSLTLVAIPLFLLMAEFASASGIIRRIFDVGNRILGGFKAGVGYATVVANAAMAALSGSSVAATGLLARICVPEMVRLGYSKPLALGLTATSGTIAVMIPPSIGLIVYGVITQTSIGRLLLAGAIPGLATALAYAGVLRGWAFVRPGDVPPSSRESRAQAATEQAGGATEEEAERTSILSYGFDVLLFGGIVAVVLGAIYTGAATVTEAAALGALATLLAWLLATPMKRRQAATARPSVEAGVRAGSPVDVTAAAPLGGREMQPGLPSDERFTRANVVHAARSAVSVTVMIMALIIMAQVLAAWLTRSGLTRSALAFFDGLDWHRLTILIAISVFLIVLGMFMSQIEILVITLPFLFPLVTGVLDYHPIWFGIWMTKLLEIGLVTPPLGMNIFVTVSALGPGYKVTDAFRGVTPFYFADLVILAGLLVFPEVVTWVDRAI